MTNKLDSLGIEDSLNLFPEQIKRTYKEVIGNRLQVTGYENIIISGMGGSSNAGKIIQSWQEETNKIPLTIFNGYGLPGWVNEKTLVILNSYSGNTEETISAHDTARKFDCQIVGTSTGGKIGDLIKSGEIKGAVFSAGDTNPSGYPKSGLGVSFGALVGVLEKVGFLKNAESEINSALDELVEVRKTWNAQDTAKWLEGSLPVFFGSKIFLGALNAGRNAVCEIGRVFTQFYDFPEVNHVLIEALKEPALVLKNKYLFFESKLDNERIKLRYKITKDLFDEMGLNYKSYILKSKGFLGQLFEIVHYCTWIGFHLSILRNDDPGPEPWILKLKSAILNR
ncbi:hypothetical protein A2130_01985 [Candidatus Woesebacteria bacterium GWC2_33_12]|uniref:Bifunctional phosphoglucose/phosphomannose isomerase n=1 Tax=Candidatus Woesebacteria bacterium GW2011_GWB1_33_22 TaxID=1618566 RepID=A0A0G0CNL8_9BACT|nr:MAG: Bifunctional phosphoglucose/phosphomannose isomerase [Candidatus Woesebacteria bacterium GW2011_GWC2_33_12]KKP42271.1 MAG: Bifunctional phosphoglucose/phosphomannose isomerase [Candidatus Woesebacteria bacterium GW2011_GWA2_33_20]KKP45002.1 MAG: Bifunctional phosphoglucose/phosphomannose isomerase [Candidatus Woesebacteria bacterium GW2011_GWB1_33_22]KKP46851.1 MAG: Bifunctional phosphoglucose/phosphomannose isomerase [Microgenomates group bacterium GW2011_GWC1_33_28]KKP50723.1 MAG: Bif